MGFVALASVTVAVGCNGEASGTSGGTTTPQTYRISGAIGGATAAGVTVTLAGPSSASTSTSSAGDFDFDGLANGTYTVAPSKGGFTFDPVSRIVVVNGGNATSQNFTATAAITTHAISGTVSGATAQGVTVTLSGTASGGTTTAAGGTYSFTGLVNGAYTVTPTKAGYTFNPTSQPVTVNGANVPGQDFVATALTYAISGHVSGATADDVTIALSGDAAGVATTAGGGAYSFSGVPNGSYTVTPSKPGYTFSPPSLGFAVSGGNATGKDFLASTGSSTAPVLDAGFPRCAWINNTTTASMTVGPFTTAGPRTYVATVSFYTPANDPYPLSLTWVGGAPAGATTWTRRTWPNDGSIHWTAEIWTATATGGLASVQVNAARAHVGDASTSILCVYSYSGVGGLGAVADHHSPMSDVGANISGTYDVTINAQASNSVIVGISQGGDTYHPFTARSNTTIDYQQNDGGADGGAASWRKTTPTSAAGNVTLGCTDSDLAFAVEAIELRAVP